MLDLPDSAPAIFTEQCGRNPTKTGFLIFSRLSWLVIRSSPNQHEVALHSQGLKGTCRGLPFHDNGFKQVCRLTAASAWLAAGPA